MNKLTKEIQPFADFSEEINELEEEYYSYLNSLSTDLAKSGKNQYEERSRKRGSMPCIAFYTPFWYASSYGLKDKESVKQVAMGNFYLYHFVTLKDDALDQRNTNMDVYLILSDILLEKTIETYSQFVPRKELHSHITKFMHEWEEAEEHLRTHQNNILPYSNKDIKMMGKKASMIKLCLPILDEISRHQQPFSLAYIENATDNAATGLQFMDDLLDWREDLDAKLYTYPLYMALSSCQQKVQSNQNDIKYQISEKLYLNGITEHVIEKANEYLALSSNLFTNINGKYWKNFLDFTNQENSRLIELIQLKKRTQKYKNPQQNDLLELEHLVKIYSQQT